MICLACDFLVTAVTSHMILLISVFIFELFYILWALFLNLRNVHKSEMVAAETSTMKLFCFSIFEFFLYKLWTLYFNIRDEHKFLLQLLIPLSEKVETWLNQRLRLGSSGLIDWLAASCCATWTSREVGVQPEM